MTVQTGRQFTTQQTHYLRKTVTFGDGGSTVSLGWVPAGALVLGGSVTVTTAFDAGTNNLVDLGFRNAGDGTTADPDEFATDLDVSSVGQKVADEIATAGDLLFPLGAELTATVDLTGTAATAGAAVVVVEFIPVLEE